MKLYALILFSVFTLGACASNPINAVPVTGFDSDRYLGTWYEVARLDHVFERGLSDVTANYAKRDDGKITVLNRGYSDKRGKFKTAEGKAKFASEKTTGHLKVSFFGPFYGDYIIFGLDKTGYSHAYISGGNDKYLWLLSRTPTVPAALRRDFLDRSAALGYDTDAVIWVDQSRAIQSK